MSTNLKLRLEERPEHRDLLNEEVAARLLGYRWVIWKKDGFPTDSEDEGKFLAPADGPLAAHQLPAGSEVPFSKHPDRYLPRATTDMWEAFELAACTGLFAICDAHLIRNEFGECSVRTSDDRIRAFGPSLPEALCRAALQWHALRNGKEGKCG